MKLFFIGKRCGTWRFRIVWLAACLLLIALVKPAFADNAVKLRILVITTGEVAEDLGFAYIKPVLEEMGVPYDVLNANTGFNGCDARPFSRRSGLRAEDAGCVGNYNGIILTDADLVPGFTPVGMGHPARLPEKLWRPPSGAVGMAGHLLGPAASLWGLPGLWPGLFVQRERL